MKRKRSFRGRIYLTGFWLVPAVVLLWLIVGWGAITAQPGVLRDWVGEANALKASLEPEGEPAWPLYREIIVDEMQRSSFEDEDVAPWLAELRALRRDRSRPSVLEREWSDEAHAPRRALLPQLARSFELLDRAAERPRMGSSYVRGIDPLSGEIDEAPEELSFDAYAFARGALRELARINLMRLREAAAENDWTRYGRAFGAGVVLADHSASGVLIESMSAQANLGIVLTEARYQLVARRIPPATARQLDQTLAERAKPLAWAHDALEIERLFSGSMLNMTYGTNGHFVDWEIADDGSVNGPPWHERLFNVRGVLEPRWDVAWGELESLIDDAQKSLRLEPTEAGRQLELLSHRELESTPVGMLTQVYPRYLRNTRESERDIRATRLMLRLEAIHAETGEWPADLSAPELAALNEDPLTGEPFVYKLTPEDAHGRAYTLHAPQTPWENLGGEDFTAPRAGLEGE